MTPEAAVPLGGWCTGRQWHRVGMQDLDASHQQEPSSKEPASLRLSMQIVPLRTIAAGEQLSWCYLPYWKQLWPTQLRRRALQESWHFHCRCPRCAGDAPERVMAFRCPACSCGELCPAAPCAGDDGHVSALASVAALVCGGCGLKLERGGGSHAGYLERCLAQEGAVFALPWREVFEPLGVSALARSVFPFHNLGESTSQKRHLGCAHQSQ